MALAFDALVKVLTLGESGCGKTSLARRFASPEEELVVDRISTIGIDFALRSLTHQGLIYKVQVWDTAGQERFRSLTKSYYRRADVILLCYDVSNRASFSRLVTWFRDLDPQIPVILVGTKNDLPYAFSRHSVEKLVREKQWEWFETSAYTGENVEQVFISCLQYAHHYQSVHVPLLLSSSSSLVKRKCC